jgi:hypothetical protein
MPVTVWVPRRPATLASEKVTAATVATPGRRPSAVANATGRSSPPPDDEGSTTMLPARVSPNIPSSSTAGVSLSVGWWALIPATSSPQETCTEAYARW